MSFHGLNVIFLNISPAFECLNDNIILLWQLDINLYWVQVLLGFACTLVKTGMSTYHNKVLEQSQNEILQIEADTKWPPFYRRRSEIDFLEWKYMNFDWNFIEFCSYESNWKYSIIDSDNGLAPTRRQAIIWTNAG